MSQPLLIYGAGGLGREVKSMLPFVTERYELIGFLDDGLLGGTMVEGIQVLGGVKWLQENKSKVNLMIAIGNPQVKAKVGRQLKQLDHVTFPILIHQHAHLQSSQSIRIERGSIICAGVILTTSITVGEHVLINLNATIGHDSSIGNYTSIMPGVNVAGNVTLGNEVMVGSGANIINNIRIGELSTIGAGSVVNHDVPAASTAAGVPARVIK